jgi:putative nucleotidyltransferase with HDIG domain
MWKSPMEPKAHKGCIYQGMMRRPFRKFRERQKQDISAPIPMRNQITNQRGDVIKSLIKAGNSLREAPMNDLEKQEIFHAMTKHLLSDAKPSEYITALSYDENYQINPFTMLWRLKATEQSEKYHPEGNVFNHTCLVLDEASKVRDRARDQKSFMWAALLHDIGKPDTTKAVRGRFTSYDHDKVGEKLCIDFLSCFTNEREFIIRTAALVRYHMHMLYVMKKLPYADMRGLIKQVSIEDIALLCRCDRLGRLGADVQAEELQYSLFLDKLMSLK